MIPELDATDIGRQIGTDGVDKVVSNAEQYCNHEQRRIELRNLPSIVALKAEMFLARERKADLEDHLRFAPPRGGLELVHRCCRGLGRSATVAPIDLHQAEVYALGVDGAGLPTTRWHDLERFWSSYFQGSGASLRIFSVLRSLPEQGIR